MLSKIRHQIAALHNDEAGEIPVGPLLIIGLIVVPIVMMLTVFRDELQEMFRGEAKQVIDATGDGSF